MAFSWGTTLQMPGSCPRGCYRALPMANALPKVDLDAIPKPVQELCAKLRKHGHRSWVVGGCIRDLLLGRPVSDWDICSSAKPEQVKAVFRKVIPTGIEHGTVSVLLHGEAYEVTTLRGEGAYSDGRRPDEVFFVDDIAEDLARRDFTVNAIAFDPVERELVDPFGGLEDLKAGLLRAVGEPAERFAEDGLRILRGARFVATLGFDLEARTEAAFADVLDTYAKVSHERIREEWLKAFRKAPTPSAAFEVMKRTGILKRTAPMLEALSAQTLPSGASAWALTMASIDAQAPAAPSAQLACLFALLGRNAATTPSVAAAHAADLARGWLKDFRFSNAEVEGVCGAIAHHRNLDGGDALSDAQLRRFLFEAGSAALPALALAKALAAADEAGDLALPSADCFEALRTRLDAQKDAPISLKALEVNGKDVMAALGGGGRRVGSILQSLLDEVLEDPSRNDREHLLGRVNALAEQAS